MSLARAVLRTQRPLARCFSDKVVVNVEAKSLAIEQKEGPVTTLPGQAFVGDLRSTSGLCMGDDLITHTSKWMDGPGKSPMEYIQETQPIKVHGLTVASYGSEDPALGCPVEYISLKGTSYEHPAVCKYTGQKFYSDDWVGGGAH